MKTTKVHVKILPVLSTNSIPNDSDEYRCVRQHIDAARRARKVMLQAFDGEVQHVAPACAKKFLDATSIIYDLLDQVDHRLKLEKRAGLHDFIFVLRLNAELDKLADDLFVRAHLAMGSPPMAWMPGFVAGCHSLSTGGAK
jgi:hypothetical protein